MYIFKVNDSNFLPHCGCAIEIVLKEGEALMIAGENGLGKSSLIRRISHDHPGLISFIEQTSLDLFYNRTLKKIKELYLESCEGQIDQAFFHHCWKVFGLVHREDRFQASLSGGEGQSLKLCLGLARLASVYVLDEPSQFLDENSKSALSDCISILSQNKKSFIIVEHDFSWQRFPASIIQLEQVDLNLRTGKIWSI